MPEPEGELDLPIPVPRRRRRRVMPESPAPAQQAAVLPISAQYAAVLAMLAWVVTAMAGWGLAGALGGPPLAGAVLGAAVEQVVEGLLVVPVLARRRSWPCSDPVRGRVIAAGAEVGVKVADVRTLGSSRGPVRSVAVVGSARRPRVILGEQLAASAPPELEALVAHQIVKSRGLAPHRLISMTILIWAVFGVLIDWWDTNAVATLLLMLMACLYSGLLATGLCLRFADRRADRRVGEALGAGRLAGALESQQRAGDICPPGFSLWIYLVCPQSALPDRLARLRAAQCAPSTAPPAESSWPNESR
ncbi:hypothetical protein [Parafrankia sp. FMc2]|uniref:hypothetical protein n=1 Tax=Parafrankia sp. FMc2 TaxID=3233196 RepID=UPI0034D5280E